MTALPTDAEEAIIKTVKSNLAVLQAPDYGSYQCFEFFQRRYRGAH